MNGMYEELIEKLRKNNRMSGWTHIDRLIDEAAEAIEALQQENNGWRERYDELDAGHSRLFKDFCKLQQENEQLQELAKAKADGRLKILPAKPGDIIYRPEALQYCWVIANVEIYEDEIVFIDDSDNIFRPDDIGKTVFLTREEAEKALDELQKKDKGEG
jgi:predicted nuclease with TOPRIM domain